MFKSKILQPQPKDQEILRTILTDESKFRNMLIFLDSSSVNLSSRIKDEAVDALRVLYNEVKKNEDVSIGNL